MLLGFYIAGYLQDKHGYVPLTLFIVYSMCLCVHDQFVVSWDIYISLICCIKLLGCYCDLEVCCGLGLRTCKTGMIKPRLLSVELRAREREAEGDTQISFLVDYFSFVCLTSSMIVFLCCY